MMDRRQLAVVIPAYNEAVTLRTIAHAAFAEVPRVIVIDDGSTDGTARAVAGLPVTLLRNPHNLGKAASLWRGIDTALAEGAQGIVTLDGDGQHEPLDLPRLIDAFEAHRDAIIVGSRLHAREHIPRNRYYANRFANFWISWAAGQAIEDTQCGYRIYPAKVLLALRQRLASSRGFVFESEILIEAGRQGTSIVTVPVTVVYPQGRRSRFRPVTDIALIVRMVAWKLASRGFYPHGLMRYWRQLASARKPRSSPRCS